MPYFGKTTTEVKLHFANYVDPGFEFLIELALCIKDFSYLHHAYAN